MSKPRSRVADYAVYLVVRVGICILQMLSFELACRVGDFLAWLAYHLDRRHRQVADDNIRQAFPGKYSPAQRDAMVREVYRHFCIMLVEIMQLPRRLNVGNWKKFIELPHGRQLAECLLWKRPLLMVTGHFGNWEMAGYSLGLLGFITHAIARPLDNPYADEFLRRFRERNGQKILAKHGDFSRMQAILDDGEALGTLADQDAGPRGLFVDFFGRPASTHKAVALLALEHRVPLLVVATPRIAGRYHVLIEDLIFPEDYEGRPDAVREITQRFTRGLENLVRRQPEQYFWLHRRWKHQPAKPRRKPAAA